MDTFVDAVREFVLREKGVDIDTLDYREEMPVEREKYNLKRVTGNVNLVAGRFKTKQEANAIVERFLSRSLPT